MSSLPLWFIWFELESIFVQFQFLLEERVWPAPCVQCLFALRVRVRFSACDVIFICSCCASRFGFALRDWAWLCDNILLQQVEGNTHCCFSGSVNLNYQFLFGLNSGTCVWQEPEKNMSNVSVWKTKCLETDRLNSFWYFVTLYLIFIK